MSDTTTQVETSEDTPTVLAMTADEFFALPESERKSTLHTLEVETRKAARSILATFGKDDTKTADVLAALGTLAGDGKSYARLKAAQDAVIRETWTATRHRETVLTTVRHFVGIGAVTDPGPGKRPRKGQVSSGALGKAFGLSQSRMSTIINDIRAEYAVKAKGDDVKAVAESKGLPTSGDEGKVVRDAIARAARQGESGLAELSETIQRTGTVPAAPVKVHTVDDIRSAVERVERVLGSFTPGTDEDMRRIAANLRSLADMVDPERVRRSA